MTLQEYLEEFGLNSYQERAYLTLLETGAMTAKQICSAANVPYGRVYDILSSLVKLGLISEIPSEPKVFKIIDPKLALKLHFEKKIESAKTKLASLKGLEIPAPKPQAQPYNEVLVLHGKDKFYDMLKQFIQTTQSEFLAVAEDLAHPQSVTYLTKRAKAQGKIVKIVLAKLTSENKPIVSDYLKGGISMRIHALKNLRMLIKDREEVLQSIVDPVSKERISIYTRNKDYAASMAKFFDSLWDKSKEINKQ